MFIVFFVNSFFHLYIYIHTCIFIRFFKFHESFYVLELSLFQIFSYVIHIQYLFVFLFVFLFVAIKPEKLFSE